MATRDWIERYGERFLQFLPVLLPLLLLPLALEWEWRLAYPDWFRRCHDDILFADIAYIFAVRLLVLDAMLFFVGRARHALRTALMRIVALYLEITAVTITYFTLLYNLFGVFGLFHFSVDIAPTKLAAIESHGFLTALYISAETFTTLGLGDWVPQTLNAMFTLSVEAILGMIQSGVFLAIIIYAHQSRIREPVPASHDRS